MILDIKDARHTRASFAGADHIGRRAGAQQQTQCVHHDGFAASGFAGEQVQAGMEMDAQALDDSIVLHYEFQEHACADYSGVCEGGPGQKLAPSDAGHFGFAKYNETARSIVSRLIRAGLPSYSAMDPTIRNMSIGKHVWRMSPAAARQRPRRYSAAPGSHGAW